MNILITGLQQPPAQPNSLMVVTPYIGDLRYIKQQLPLGIYFSYPNPNTQAAQTIPYVWFTIFDVIGYTIAAMIATAIAAIPNTTLPTMVTVQGQGQYDLTKVVPNGYSVDYVFFAGIGLTNNPPPQQWGFLYNTKQLYLATDTTTQGGQELKIFIRKGTDSTILPPPTPPTSI